MIRPYLESARPTTKTDRDKNKKIFKLADATGQLTRWVVRPSKFDFDVIDCAGVKVHAICGLCRLTATREDRRVIENDVRLFIIKLQTNNGPYIAHISVMTALSDEIDIWAVAEITENSDTEKGEQHQHYKNF